MKNTFYTILAAAVITLTACTNEGVKEKTTEYCKELIEAAKAGDADRMGQLREEMEDYRSKLYGENLITFNKVLEKYASEITSAALSSTGNLMQQIDEEMRDTSDLLREYENMQEDFEESDDSIPDDDELMEE